MEKERFEKVVQPDRIHVNIHGTSMRKVLLMHKPGTIPEEEEVDLLVFEKPDR